MQRRKSALLCSAVHRPPLRTPTTLARNPTRHTAQRRISGSIRASLVRANPAIAALDPCAICPAQGPATEPSAMLAKHAAAQNGNAHPKSAGNPLSSSPPWRPRAAQ